MNYMTVGEVAAYLKLSPIMIYKLAKTGRIPGRKIGRVWRFAKDTIDAWMHKSAQPTVSVLTNTGDVRTIISDFVLALRDTYGPRLRHAVLFGSNARGEASDNSDIDVLVVLDRIDITDRRKVSELAYTVTFGQGRSRHLSSIVMAEQSYLTDVTPLLINIRKEGREAA